MTKSPCLAGYGRPPAHSRFQKGQSGNPGGKPGPKKLLKQDFETALGEALDADVESHRLAKPGRAIESFARQLALGAVDGRPAAQRLVLSILDAGNDVARAAPREQETDDALFGEGARQMFGERYEEFKQRYRAAVDSGSVEELVKLVEDFDGAEFPQ